MSIQLPTDIGPASAEPSYLDWGGMLRPIFGGALQKLLRLGDRFAIDVTMPVLKTEADGRIWTASLILAQRQGAILAWPQLGLDTGTPGTPVVDGAGQSGSSINLRGFTPGYVVKLGQFFSIIQGGRRYLHMAAADRTANGAGVMTLPISPMLRMQPGNGATCEFAVPMIEGFLDGDVRKWSLDVAMTTGLSFSIMEVK